MDRVEVPSFTGEDADAVGECRSLAGRTKEFKVTKPKKTVNDDVQPGDVAAS